MRKIKNLQSHCTYCNGNGYIQLLLGGSETCEECYSITKWVKEPAKKAKKVQIDLVHLRLS